MKKLIICTYAFALISVVVTVNGDEVSPPSVLVSTESSVPKINSNTLRRPLPGAKIVPKPNVQKSAPVVWSPVITPKITPGPVDTSNSNDKAAVASQLKSSNVLNSDGSFEFILAGPDGSIRINGNVKNVDGVTTLEISGLYKVGASQFNFIGNEEGGFKLIPIGAFVPSIAPKAIRTIVG